MATIEGRFLRGLLYTAVVTHRASIGLMIASDVDAHVRKNSFKFFKKRVFQALSLGAIVGALIASPHLVSIGIRNCFASLRLENVSQISKATVFNFINISKTGLLAAGFLNSVSVVSMSAGILGSISMDKEESIAAIALRSVLAAAIGGVLSRRRWIK